MAIWEDEGWIVLVHDRTADPADDARVLVMGKRKAGREQTVRRDAYWTVDVHVPGMPTERSF